MLQFRRVKVVEMRESVARGTLTDLEISLLKKYGEQMRWGAGEKAAFLKMYTHFLEASVERMRLEIRVRVFCHSWGVTADYLNAEDNLNNRPCVLVIGDVGAVPDPWAGLIQPALFLHMHGFNVLSIEVPELATSMSRWLASGPKILRETLRFLNTHTVGTLCSGNGGSVFLEAIGESRDCFGATHFAFNIDCPKGTKKAPFPMFKLEEHLRRGNLQFWFGFCDEEGIYDHHTDGTPRRCFDAVNGLQARLEGERRRGKRIQDHDEVLISEHLNSPKIKNVDRMVVGRNTLFAFSDELLASIARFLEHPPRQCQEDLDKQGGLVMELKMFGAMKPGEALPELPSLRVLRLGPEAEALYQLAIMDPGETRVYRRRAQKRNANPLMPSWIENGSDSGSRRTSRTSSAPQLALFQSDDSPAPRKVSLTQKPDDSEDQRSDMPERRKPSMTMKRDDSLELRAERSALRKASLLLMSRSFGPSSKPRASGDYLRDREDFFFDDD